MGLQYSMYQLKDPTTLQFKLLGYRLCFNSGWEWSDLNMLMTRKSKSLTPPQQQTIGGLHWFPKCHSNCGVGWKWAWSASWSSYPCGAWGLGCRLNSQSATRSVHQLLIFYYLLTTSQKTTVASLGPLLICRSYSILIQCNLIKYTTTHIVLDEQDWLVVILKLDHDPQTFIADDLCGDHVFLCTHQAGTRVPNIDSCVSRSLHVSRWVKEKAWFLPCF